jgi:hypothetical protein
MAGLPQGPLRRLLSRLPSRLLARQPPVSPMSPPRLPPVTRAEILSRYRHLRQISKEQHEAVLDITAADVLLDWARRIDLTQGRTVISDSEYEMRSPRIWRFIWPGWAAHTRSTVTPELQVLRLAPTKRSCSRPCAKPASRSGTLSGTTKPPV